MKEDHHIFNFRKDEVLLLNKPLYGLCDSGIYWNVTIHDHIIKDLKMDQSMSDPSLYFLFIIGNFSGLTGNYVDDSLNAGDICFQSESELTT